MSLNIIRCDSISIAGRRSSLLFGNSIGCIVRDFGVSSLWEITFRIPIFRILIISLDVGGDKEFIKYLIDSFIII